MDEQDRHIRSYYRISSSVWKNYKITSRLEEARTRRNADMRPEGQTRGRPRQLATEYSKPQSPCRGSSLYNVTGPIQFSVERVVRNIVLQCNAVSLSAFSNACGHQQRFKFLAKHIFLRETSHHPLCLSPPIAQN